MTILLATVGVVVLVVIAAALAAVDASINLMGRSRSRSMVTEGRHGAELLSMIVHDRARALNPVTFAMLGCHLAAATIVAALVGDRFGLLGLLGAFGLLWALIYLVAEAVPKAMVLRNPDASALRFARPVRFLGNLWPIGPLGNALFALANRLTPGEPVEAQTVSEEELKELVLQAADDLTIEDRERDMIESVIDFGDALVREVMVPRPDMKTINAADTVGEALDASIRVGYSRIPVIDDAGEVVGVAYARNLMKAVRAGRANQPVGVGEDAHWVPELKKAAELLDEMLAHKFHLAMVADEYGDTAGLVSLEDLIEQLVGQIQDEADVETEWVTKRGDDSLVAQGRTPIDRVNAELQGELPHGPWDTVGGLLFDKLGSVPTSGDEVIVAGHRLIARDVLGRRIKTVVVVPPPASSPDAAPALADATQAPEQRPSERSRR